MKKRVLIVDDEPQMRLAMRRVLARGGYLVEEAANGEDALEMLRRDGHAVVVTDVRMPRLDGMGFLARARGVAPRTAFLMITAYGTVESAVEAVRRGARDYILKPFPPEVLERAVVEAFRALDEEDDPRKAAAPAEAAPPAAGAREREAILTCEPAMEELLAQARRAAASEATILIEAESGTGKELLARFIHRESPRASGPFVALNCAAFPHELLESELFGHARGAFTGALRERRGHFEAASGGTILLDEVGEMSPGLQAKLLRVLQEREVQRLGEETPRAVDVRVVASTNRDLVATVRAGRFREDLYFRLSVIPLRIPPLRERTRDVTLLAQRFCARYGHGAGPHRISAGALSALRAHTWPGNVRELENVVQRAVVLAKGQDLEAMDFFPEGALPDSRGILLTSGPGLPGRTLEEAERLLIEDALRQTRGNRTRAAAIVGISVRTLRNKLRIYRHADGGPAGPASEPSRSA